MTNRPLLFFACLIVACLSGCTHGSGAPPGQTPHPVLLIPEGGLEALRARVQGDGTQAQAWGALLGEAKAYPPPLPTVGPQDDIRGYGDRLCTLGLAGLCDPLQPLEGRFRDYCFTMLRYPNWEDPNLPFNNADLTRSHFLLALSLAYDWFGSRFTGTERAEIRTLLARHAQAQMDSSFTQPRAAGSWENRGLLLNNHFWINNAALAAAALALQGDLPEATWRPWLERSETNLDAILAALPPDGASPEGVAYNTYGLSSLLLWIDLRDRAHPGAEKARHPGLCAAFSYHLYSMLPGGDHGYGGSAPFGDSPEQPYQPLRTLMAWFARHGREPHAQWLCQSLDWKAVSWPMLLWYDPSVPAAAPGELPTARLFPDKGIYVWRSSWGNAATYFSLKCGTYEGGHEQPDAGHFVLERQGIPYLTDERYTWKKDTRSHNTLLVNQGGQMGEGSQWMPVQDPATRGCIESELTHSDYFDIVANPGPRYGSAALTSWRREVLHPWADLFIVRDLVHCPAPVLQSLLLHSYCSTASPGIPSLGDWLPLVKRNPWKAEAPSRWALSPREGAPALEVEDLSGPGWSASLEASLFTPEITFDTRSYNAGMLPFQKGWSLTRSARSAEGDSLVLLGFPSSPWSVQRLEGSWGEGLLLGEGSRSLRVIWPGAGRVPDALPLSGAGAMLGGRGDAPIWFGRALTLLRDQGKDRLLSSAPVDAYLEFTPAAGALALIRAAGAVTVRIALPRRPVQVLLDGAAGAFSWDGGQLGLDLPAGSHRVEIACG